MSNYLYCFYKYNNIKWLSLGGTSPPIRPGPGVVQWTCISGRSKLGRSKRGWNGVERGEVCPPPDRNGLEEQNKRTRRL